MLPLKSILRWLVLTIFLIVITAPNAALSAKCEGKSHNATFGILRAGEKLLFKENIKQTWKFLRSVQKDIIFPLKNDKRKYIITHIKLTDRYTNGHGGCPEIKEGGIGKDHVKIHIKSEFTRGFDFIVEIYGMKKSKAKKLKYY